MRSQLALRLRSTSIPLNAIPPAQHSDEYSTDLADLAAKILYRSPLPSQADLPIFILNAAALPDAKNTDYDALLPYVLARLPDEEELIGGQGYELVFFAGGSSDGPTATKKGRPGWGWFIQAYHVLTRAMRKRLTKLYIVNEKNWIRILIEMFSTAVSPKFRRKIVHASTLSGLALHIPIENLLIPPSAYLTDRKLCNEIYAPYSSGKRAFAVKEPLPFSSAGTHRLPRVLRETTSFVIADPVIKTEGIFRISPRATIVDILKEAYDRGQKFIVWKERNVSMSQGHMKEGTGTVYVEELEHTEGYDVHAAAAVIKQWYRELRDPIFPPSCYPALERFYGASYSETETPLQVSQLLEILAVGDEWSPITEASRIILTMHLLPLLSRVIEYQEWNQMTAYNLAVCFAPCLLRGHDPMEDVKISSIIRRILMALIMHWKADLAPKFEAGQQNFEDLLRLPEAIEDREDPLQEAQEPRSSLETQVTGVTLIDNEDSDEEIEESPPPLPPRPVTSPVENTLADGTAVRRKPAPPIQTLPRYSMIVNDTPVTLEHIPFYNTVAPEDEMQPPRGLDSLQELPEYEPSLARLSNCDTQQKPLGDKRHVEELRDRGGPLAEPSDSNAQQRLSKSIHDAEELKDQKGSFSIESPPFLTVAQMSSSSSANAQESSEPENPSPVAPSPVLSPTLVTRKPLPSARSGP